MLNRMPGLYRHLTQIDAQPDQPAWVSSAEVMSPLLAAYDGRIQV